MRTTPLRDLCVAKTLEAIEASLRAMMLEGGPESITVKAICEGAYINKETFHRHYETLGDLLVEAMAACAAARRDAPPTCTCHGTWARWRASSSAWALIRARCTTPSPAARRSTTGIASPRTTRATSTPGAYRRLLARAVKPVLRHRNAAALAMYRAWVADDKVIPMEEAADHAACLFCRGSDAWLAGVRSCAHSVPLHRARYCRHAMDEATRAPCNRSFFPNPLDHYLPFS